MVFNFLIHVSVTRVMSRSVFHPASDYPKSYITALRVVVLVQPNWRSVWDPGFEDHHKEPFCHDVVGQIQGQNNFLMTGKSWISTPLASGIWNLCLPQYFAKETRACGWKTCFWINYSNDSIIKCLISTFLKCGSVDSIKTN